MINPYYITSSTKVNILAWVKYHTIYGNALIPYHLQKQKENSDERWFKSRRRGVMNAVSEARRYQWQTQAQTYRQAEMPSKQTVMNTVYYKTIKPNSIGPILQRQDLIVPYTFQHQTAEKLILSTRGHKNNYLFPAGLQYTKAEQGGLCVW